MHAWQGFVGLPGQYLLAAAGSTYSSMCRGVVLEALGQFEDALTDYRAVLEVQPQDPAAWNNLGNASAGLARWRDAANFYGKAASLAPEFAFSAANKAVVLFQLGETDESMREMRCGLSTTCSPLTCTITSQ